MGLFNNHSNLRTKDGVSLEPAEAFAAITLASIAADGYLTDDEIQIMIASLSRMHLFQNYPSEALRKMFDKLCGYRLNNPG